jgi:hypothetical protein
VSPFKTINPRRLKTDFIAPLIRLQRSFTLVGLTDSSAGLTSIAQDFYSGGRHEMLHEINRRDVITNLLV